MERVIQITVIDKESNKKIQTEVRYDTIEQAYKSVGINSVISAVIYVNEELNKQLNQNVRLPFKLTVERHSKKRFFIIFYKYGNITGGSSAGNVGISTDGDYPSQLNLTEKLSEKVKDLMDGCSVVVTNIIELNETDYNSFIHPITVKIDECPQDFTTR